MPEIDGVRAIAVLAVVFFHMSPNLLPGGFVGVDVFFVISGFLISGIIFREIDAGTFSFARFYIRRIRRILPALFALVLCTALVFSVWFAPSEYQGFASSALAAILSYSNIFFYFNVDYFANNLDEPLLHTWSLAVEEQFYVIFPVAIVLVSRLAPRLRVPFLLAATVASLVGSIVLTWSDQQAAYYLPLARAWELLAGCLLALVPREKIEARWKTVASSLGILGLLTSAVVINEEVPFPGYAALLPVVSTCLSILGAGGLGPANLVLRTAPMLWVGRISYSVYLFHWPIICLAAALFSVGSFASFAVLLPAILIVSWASHRFVEMPFRGSSVSRPARWFFGAGAAGVMMCLAIVGLNFGNARFWTNYPRAQNYQLALAYDHDREFSVGRCFLSSGFNSFSIYDQSECLRIDPDRHNLLLVGDSHSAQYITALRSVFPDINFLQASASGCRPILPPVGEERCTDLVNFVLTKWLPLHASDVDGVILSGLWQDSEAVSAVSTVGWIEALGVPVLVFGPAPIYAVPVPRLLSYEEVLSSAGFSMADSLSTVLRKAEGSRADEALKNALPDQYVSIRSLLCSGSGACELERDGVVLIFDRHHLTKEGASIVLGLVADRLRNAFRAEIPASPD